MLDKRPLRIVCPICKAKPSQPCKSVDGRYMRRFHHERYQKRVPREDVNRAAARIVWMPVIQPELRNPELPHRQRSMIAPAIMRSLTAIFHDEAVRCGVRSAQLLLTFLRIQSFPETQSCGGSYRLPVPRPAAPWEARLCFPAFRIWQEPIHRVRRLRPRSAEQNWDD